MTNNILIIIVIYNVIIIKIVYRSTNISILFSFVNFEWSVDLSMKESYGKTVGLCGHLTVLMKASVYDVE